MRRPGSAGPPRIYLAGPEVFLPDAVAVGARKAEACAEHGLEGVFPLDNALDLAGLDRKEQARRISLSNEALMRSCDAAIANLTPFRGASADAGTAFEVGFMRALGRPVLGYTNTPLVYRERAQDYRMHPNPRFDFDGAGVEVEDFDLAENLMIEIAIMEAGSQLYRQDTREADRARDLAAFERCLVDARRLLLEA